MFKRWVAISRSSGWFYFNYPTDASDKLFRRNELLTWNGDNRKQSTRTTSKVFQRRFGLIYQWKYINISQFIKQSWKAIAVQFFCKLCYNVESRVMGWQRASIHFRLIVCAHYQIESQFLDLVFKNVDVISDFNLNGLCRSLYTHWRTECMHVE